MASSPNTPSPTDSEYPRWSETLHDRSHVLIRPITSQDKAEERAFIEELSAEAKRFRFLGQIRSASDRMIERFTDIDQVHDVAFAAITHEDSRDRIVGVSRFAADPEGLRCECAVTVSDTWHNKGLGTLLMKHLIEVARSRGITTMYSIDSCENLAMKDLATYLGFHTRVDPDDARQVIHELEL